MALISDNSGAEPRLVAEKMRGTITVDPSTAEPVRRATATLDDAEQSQS